MAYDPQTHRRRSTRLRRHEYSEYNPHLVTTLVTHKESLSGRIVESEMVLSDAGPIVMRVWNQRERLASVAFDAFQIMLNHVHAIIVIPGSGLEPALAHATGAPIIQPGPAQGPVLRQCENGETNSDYRRRG
jgi:REP element-mobilizing transposase RayT